MALGLPLDQAHLRGLRAPSDRAQGRGDRSGPGPHGGGGAVLPLYIAEKVDDSARALLERKSKIRFAFFYLPAALDLSSGRAHYLRGTPYWGAIYYSKFRFLIRRLLDPAGTPTSWPVSALGTILGFLLVGLLAAAFALFAARR
jgi:hypothetical protein